MLGGGTLALLVVLLLVSVVARETALFLLALALLLADGLSRLWERYCLTRVGYRRHFSHRQVPFGEDVELEIEVVNRKLLPLAWLESEDEVPSELLPSRGHTYSSHKPKRLLLANLLAFRPYERVRRRYTLPCRVRGEHVFGPLRLRSGDLFGFVTREQDVDLIETVVVYPRVLPLADLGLPARQPLGDLRARSWLFENPTRIAGAREYRPGDGLRRIHWAATARTQQLQSKVYEATTSHKVGVFLDLATDGGRWWGQLYDPDVLELTIIAAASIASWAIEQGYQVGLYTNGMHRWSWGDVAVEPGGDPAQLERVLVALGRLQPFAVKRFEDVLAEEVRHLPFGSTLVVVAAELSPEVVDALRALRGRGHAVTVVLAGRQDVAGSLDGIPVRRVGPPEAWREGSALAVTGGEA